MDIKPIIELIQKGETELAFADFNQELIDLGTATVEQKNPLKSHFDKILSQFNLINNQKFTREISESTYSLTKSKIIKEFLDLLNLSANYNFNQNEIKNNCLVDFGELSEAERKVKQIYDGQILRESKNILYSNLSEFYINDLIKPVLKKQAIDLLNLKKGKNSKARDVKVEFEKEFFLSLHNVTTSDNFNISLRTIILKWIKASQSQVLERFQEAYEGTSIDIDSFSLASKINIFQSYFEIRVDINDQLSKYLKETFASSFKQNRKLKWYYGGALLPYVGAMFGLAGYIAMPVVGIITLWATLLGGFKITDLWMKFDTEGEGFLESIIKSIEKDEMVEVKKNVYSRLENNSSLNIYLDSSINKWVERLFLEQMDFIQKEKKKCA